MKLTKTERLLLEKAKDDPYGIQVDVFYGQGPEGGRVSYGWREYRAFRKLVEKGLLERKNTWKGSRAERGYTVHHGSQTGLITDAGRTALL